MEEGHIISGSAGRWPYDDLRAVPSSVPEIPSDLAAWERYRLVERLGAGGMGEVYKAHDPRLDRHVAIKLLHSTSRETERRLLREAQAQARVEHEHVCKVYEVGEVAGRP